MKKIRSIQYLILYLIGISNLIAQVEGSFNYLSIKDGLSHNEIWGFEQDKYGYMWIATSDGLNKYDGYSFKIFKNDPEDSTSLPANLTSYVLEDKDGALWISTSNGLSKFNRENKTFKNYQFVNSSRENANFIASLFEDSKGMLWVCTNNGFRTFDRINKTFTEYEVLRDDNVVAKLNNPTYNLIETKSGELFGSCISYGLVKFDYENKLFIQLKLDNKLQSKLKRQTVLSLMEDSNGDVWYGGQKGLYKINVKKLSGEEILNSLAGESFKDTGGIFETKNGEIWIGTFMQGLFQYNLLTKKIIKLPVNSRGFYNFYKDKTGLLWMGTFDEGIIKYNFGNTPFELFSFKNTINQAKPVTLCFEQSIKYANIIWLGTNKGLYIYNKVDKSINNSSPIIPRIDKRNELKIEGMVETAEGKLYLGTTDNGLISCDLLTGKIDEYKPIRYSRTSIGSSDVNVLLEDSDKRLWVGQDSGLRILNSDANSFLQLPNKLFRQYSEDLVSFLEKLRESRTPLLRMIQVGDFAELSKEFVLSKDASVFISGIGEGNQQSGMVDYGMLQSADGDTLWSMKQLDSTWYATGSGKNRHKIGLFKLKKGRYKLLYKTDDSHSAEFYNAAPPKDSLYWGIELYTISDNEFENYSIILDKNKNSSFMIGNSVNSIFESSDKMIWISTSIGLSIIDPKTFQIKNINMVLKDELSISSDRVEDICEDKFGNIWIATQDGLNKYNRISNTIKVYREKDGLPSNGIKALQLDDDGNLWVSTIKGISKIEISDSSQYPIVINYDVRDGLQGYTFIGNASMRDSEGKIYFSGPDGFNTFTPGITDKSLPNIVLNGISVSNKSLEEIGDLAGSKDLNTIEKLDLSYNQNDITIEFASIHFARPDKNRLQYKLEGLDDIWHDGSRQIATYANLDPGEYAFNLKGSNGDGIWTEKNKRININISPAWYNNWTAYSIYALLFFGLLYGIRKFEMGRQEKNTKLKESQLRIEAAEANAKAAESDKRALQVEFEHKKKELDEARELQLSMLPRELPQLPNLDIAVYMKTATEVGGDYYDFHIGLDGMLTVVLGDATGHGMKAGTMVTTTKSLFNVLAPNPNIVETFHEMTRCLKLMHMQNLSMCMTMIKMMGNKLQMSSAGMPPVFIYKRENQSTEEHVIKGMPLGTFNKFPYKVIETELSSGDSILLMSDGFPELLNDKNEMFGYKRARNLYEDLSDESPEEIITKLKAAGSEWVNDKDPDDDVTFVVIKVK